MLPFVQRSPALSCLQVEIGTLRKLYAEVQMIRAGLAKWGVDMVVDGESSGGPVMALLLNEHQRKPPEARVPCEPIVRTKDCGPDQDKLDRCAKPLTGLNAVCDVCGQPCKPLMCAGCKKKTYCGRDCQKRDWKSGHKADCKK